jgi:tetratricopeptide (TPR) repeat protein
MERLLIESGAMQRPAPAEDLNVTEADIPMSAARQLEQLLERGDLDRARDLVVAALDSDPLEIQGMELDVAGRMAAAGRKSDVRAILERSQAVVERSAVSDSPPVLRVLIASIRESTNVGLKDDARRLLYRLETTAVMHSGAQSPEMEPVCELRGKLLDAEGRHDEAVNEFRTWLNLSAGLHGPISREAVDVHHGLAEQHARMGRTDAAKAEWLAAIEVSRALYDGLGVAHADLLTAASEYFRSLGEKELTMKLEAEVTRV